MNRTIIRSDNWLSQRHAAPLKANGERHRWLQRQPTVLARETPPPAMVLFVDPHCAGKYELISAAAGKAQTILLDRCRDGVDQISKHVGSRRPFASLLIAAADDPTSIAIGSTRLTVPGLYAYEDQLRHIGSSLARGATIRLLGRTRNAPNDEILVAMLGRLTGVEVISGTVPPHLDSVWTSSSLKACESTGRPGPLERAKPPEAFSQG